MKPKQPTETSSSLFCKGNRSLTIVITRMIRIPASGIKLNTNCNANSAAIELCAVANAQWLVTG